MCVCVYEREIDRKKALALISDIISAYNWMDKCEDGSKSPIGLDMKMANLWKDQMLPMESGLGPRKRVTNWETI